jgi:DNA-binding beta-propeller fold protein YncE
MRHLITILLAAIALLSAPLSTPAQEGKERHLLYVAAPGVRNYLEFGGAGILVFDMDNGHKFIKRIATPASKAEKIENIKGVCACARARRLYYTTPTQLYCLDLVTEKPLWNKTLPGGCDRMSITPDGKTLYVPSYEKDHWNVVDGATGDVITQITPKSGSHNTIVSLDGAEAYLAGLRSNMLPVVDAKTHKVLRNCGPFTQSIRPFTINAAKTLVYVNVNELLGFEIGDLKTGKMLHRIEITGEKHGKPARHGCPSHGIGLTPDEKEAWVCDAFNRKLHVFDATVMPPKQVAKVKLREEPGWVTFSLDGRFAYSSTGEVIDTKTKRIVVALTDEEGREVHSEKVIEIVFVDGVPTINGDQFGLGRNKK